MTELWFAKYYIRARKKHLQGIQVRDCKDCKTLETQETARGKTEQRDIKMTLKPKNTKISACLNSN